MAEKELSENQIEARQNLGKLAVEAAIAALNELDAKELFITKEGFPADQQSDKLDEANTSVFIDLGAKMIGETRALRDTGQL